MAAATFPQGVQTGTDLADHAAIDDVVLVDFGRGGMDVDQLVLVPAPKVGVVLHHVVPDADNEVGLFEPAVVVVVRLKARGAEQQRVRGRDDSLGHERRHHRDVELLGEGYQLAGRFHADHAVSRHDEWGMRCVQEGRDLVELGRIGVGKAGALPAQRLGVRHLHLGDVLGKLDEAGPRALRLRDLEGLAHDLGNGLWSPDLRSILGYRLEQADQVDHLVTLLVKTGRRSLTRDGHQRRHVHIRVGDTGDEVGRSRSERGEAYACPPGKPAVDVGHKGRSLLVSGRNEANAAGRDRVDQLKSLFAW